MLTHDELVALVEAGAIEGVDPARIGPASIDLTLGDSLLIESERGGVVDLAAKQAPALSRFNLAAARYPLRPAEFVLVSTRERFRLPDDIGAAVRLKSSAARAGLGMLPAGWVDPGFHDAVLTLALQNCCQHHQLMLSAGLPFAQIILHRGARVPESRSYRAVGRYNGSAEATASRGLQ